MTVYEIMYLLTAMLNTNISTISAFVQTTLNTFNIIINSFLMNDSSTPVANKRF